jgi:hypothetical protein
MPVVLNADWVCSNFNHLIAAPVDDRLQQEYADALSMARGERRWLVKRAGLLLNRPAPSV